MSLTDFERADSRTAKQRALEETPEKEPDFSRGLSVSLHSETHRESEPYRVKECIGPIQRQPDQQREELSEDRKGCNQAKQLLKAFDPFLFRWVWKEKRGVAVRSVRQRVEPGTPVSSLLGIIGQVGPG